MDEEDEGSEADDGEDDGEDDEEEEEEEEDEDVDGAMVAPAVLKERIAEVVEVLSDFKTRRELGRARAEYVDQLARDLCDYYGWAHF